MADTFTPEQIAQILEEFFKVVGTRKYIGERYVPIFGRKGEESIQWDNSAPYEPLTIVLYQGNSYTSRQYVPIGVDITNQEFWALTGNYNAQIENAIAIANNAQTDIDTLLPKADFSAENTVKKYIDENPTRILTFDTVADMQAATDLHVGMTCHTNGFHASGDGGAAYYTVSASGTANGMDVLTLQDGLFATMIVTEPCVTPEMFGAYGDGVHDDLQVLSYCINKSSKISGNKNYKISDTLVIQDLSKKDIRIENLISQSQSAAIHVKKSSYGNLLVNRLSAISGYGVFLIPDNDTREGIVFSTFTFNNITSLYTALMLDDNQNGYINYCSIYGYQFRTTDITYSIMSVHSTQTSYYWCNQINFYNIWFCIGKNVYLDNCDNISFINCGFESIADTGIVFDNSRTCKVTNCRIEATANYVFSFKRNAYNNVISGVPAFKFNKVDTSELTGVISNYVYNALYDNSNNPIAIKGKTTYYTKTFAPIPDGFIKDTLYLTENTVLSNNNRLYNKFNTALNTDITLTLTSIYTFDGINQIIVNNRAQRLKVYDSFGALIFDGANHSASNYLIIFINGTATSNTVSIIELISAP